MPHLRDKAKNRAMKKGYKYGKKDDTYSKKMKYGHKKDDTYGKKMAGK